MSGEFANFYYVDRQNQQNPAITNGYFLVLALTKPMAREIT